MAYSMKWDAVYGRQRSEEVVCIKYGINVQTTCKVF